MVQIARHLQFICGGGFILMAQLTNWTLAMISVRLSAFLLALLCMSAPAAIAEQQGKVTNAHSFTLPSGDGGAIALSEYKGNVVMVVNTASHCSFTKQYGPLQKLQEKYADRGLVVIGVPTNEFGGQEPGTNEEIKNFTEAKFSVDFPITAKTEITGRNAEPFYQWAEMQVGVIGKPRWNFHKYIIDPDGNLSTWFSTFTEPDAPELVEAIEALLPQKEALERQDSVVEKRDNEKG